MKKQPAANHRNRDNQEERQDKGHIAGRWSNRNKVIGIEIHGKKQKLEVRRQHLEHGKEIKPKIFLWIRDAGLDRVMKPPASDKKVKDSNKDITRIKTQYTIRKSTTASY